MSKKSDEPTPMDASIRERATGTTASNTQRVCYAIKTLVAEMHALFPETPVEYSDYDGRNTALAVSFDLSPLDEETGTTVLALFTLFDFDADPRIASVDADGPVVLISFRANARTQDSREPFGLAEAWEVLTEGDDGTGVEDVLIGWLDGGVPAQFITTAEGYPSWGGSL